MAIIRIEQGDATRFDCDVLVLKYAQARYGVDRFVASALSDQGVEEAVTSPEAGGYRLLASGGAVEAEEVLFVGVEPLGDFDYRGIRLFGRKSLEALAGERTATRHVAITLHGPGYGLDEREAFDSLIAGLLDANQTGDVPEALESISIVEMDGGRARRLAGFLEELLPKGSMQGGAHSSTSSFEDAEERLRAAGYASEGKARVFVAMPFTDEMSDHYHYGIQGAVNAAGYLCERADLTAFTGDIVDHVRNRIASAALVVADLTGANPNVYLEVGYAWGQGVRTVLLADKAENLEFNVRGQRCLTYSSIRDLEEQLHSELTRI